jgi:predicted nucleotidyltransferase
VVKLNQLIERLCDAQVDFVIVGGFAGVLYGSSLVTRDLDVCAVLNAENVARLRDALRDLHPTHRMTPQRLSFLETPDPGIGMKNLYLETELGPIDFLGSILGLGDFERVRAASIEVELFGRHCRVISIEDLIQAKEALGRDKDLIAAKELRAILEKRRS